MLTEAICVQVFKFPEARTRSPASVMAPYSFNTEQLLRLTEPRPAEPEPEPAGEDSQPQPEGQPEHRQLVHTVVHEPEHFEAKRRAWLAMMEHINCVGRYTLPKYEAVFGIVEVFHPYGHGFWVGFEKMMADYLRFHLYWHRVEHLTKGYFRKPYPFSKDTAQLPYEKRFQEGDSEFPCFFVQTQPGWYKMVCINICIWTSRPWIVHYTWIRVAVAI